MRYLILLIVLLLGCKSQQSNTKTTTNSNSQRQEIKTENQEINGSLANHFQANKLENEVLNYNFDLKSTNENKPAIVTEYRNGKPYRSIVAHNANYSENKKIKEQSKQEFRKDYTADFSALKSAFQQQNSTIVQLQKKVEKLKADNFKIANNIKYLLWFLIAFACIWIAERSGLFVLFKRLLKKV